MYYEGHITVNEDGISLNLHASEHDSEFDIEMNNNSSSLEDVFNVLKPESDVGEGLEPKSYAQSLQQKGYDTFYSSSLNVEDLISIYGHTQPKVMNPFPGLESPRLGNEIIFTETIRHFTGVLNDRLIQNKKVIFKYRGAL